VLGQLTGEDQSYSADWVSKCQLKPEMEEDVRGLDLTRGDGGLLVVGGELGSLGGDALEDIVDKRVQDGHGAVGDTGVGVDLLEDCGRVRKLC
jgi:hypothetical protein